MPGLNRYKGEARDESGEEGGGGLCGGSHGRGALHPHHQQARPEAMGDTTRLEGTSSLVGKRWSMPEACVSRVR